MKSKSSLTTLGREFFTKDAPEVAKQLIGCHLYVGQGSNRRGGIIVETEAYCQDDPASHSFRGETPRNQAMFQGPGTIYVYRSYGVHLCLNFVTGCTGDGQAVLVRAIEPTHGIDLMAQSRGLSPTRRKDLASGPGKLSQALGISMEFNLQSIFDQKLTLQSGESLRTLACPRIGISKAKERPWRFVADNNAYLSKQPQKGATL